MRNLVETYRRERKRIQNYISARKKKGFLPDFELPKIPKKITQGSINRLKKITPEKIRETEKKFVDKETGEIFEGEHWQLTKQYKKLIKAKKPKKGKPKKTAKKEKQITYADVVRSNVERTLSELPYNVEKILRNAFDAILKNGYTWNEISRKMEQLAMEGKNFTYANLYNQGKALSYSKELFEEFEVGIFLDDLEEALTGEETYEYEVTGDW